MTAEEAIKELKYRIKLSKRACLKSMPKQIKVFEVALEALEKQIDAEKEEYPNENNLGNDKTIISSSGLFKLIKKLDEYENLEEQGLLLRLPCKVGDKLYAISDTRIAECTCCEIKIGIENYVGANFNCDYDCKGCPFNSWEQDFYTGEHSCSGEYGDWYFVLDDFGKTVFLTREAAEAKLREMEG